MNEAEQVLALQMFIKNSRYVEIIVDTAFVVIPTILGGGAAALLGRGAINVASNIAHSFGIMGMLNLGMFALNLGRMMTLPRIRRPGSGGGREGGSGSESGGGSGGGPKPLPGGGGGELKPLPGGGGGGGWPEDRLKNIPEEKRRELMEIFKQIRMDLEKLTNLSVEAGLSPQDVRTLIQQYGQQHRR